MKKQILLLTALLTTVSAAGFAGCMNSDSKPSATAAESTKTQIVATNDSNDKNNDGCPDGKCPEAPKGKRKEMPKAKHNPQRKAPAEGKVEIGENGERERRPEAYTYEIRFDVTVIPHRHHHRPADRPAEGEDATTEIQKAD